MRIMSRLWISLAGGALFTFPCILSADTPADTAAEVVTGAWQHHKVTFNYVGFTAAFTCDGLGDHVRQILVHLGARRDAYVTAIGCGGPYNTPTRSAFVTADFYTLAPAAAGAGSGLVPAHWTSLEVTPRRPDFMGEGDCELMQGMKDLITQNFALRDVEYRTNCYPHQISLNGFAVKAQGLRAMPHAGGARAS
jgi:hypothetical protein